MKAEHEGLWIDPFANSNRIADITNDLDLQYETNHHLDALVFLKLFKDGEVTGGVLHDPPYSARQVSESYKKLGKTVNMQTTQSSYWSKLNSEIGRITSKDATVISFGWHSGGIGKNNGFEIQEIMLVPHGGHHNDTICVVDKKII